MPRANKIAFENLRAEMGRKELTIGKIAAAIGMNRATLGKKLSREYPLKLNEAFLIIHKCFPGERLEYIFKEAGLTDDHKEAG